MHDREVRRLLHEKTKNLLNNNIVTVMIYDIHEKCNIHDIICFVGGLVDVRSTTFHNIHDKKFIILKMHNYDYCQFEKEIHMLCIYGKTIKIIKI